MRYLFSTIASFAVLLLLPWQTTELDQRQSIAVTHAQDLNRAGAQAIAKGDLPLAKQDYTEALRLLQSTPPHPEAATAYRGLGKIAFVKGDFSQAENSWLKEVSILTAINPHSYELSFAYGNLGALAEAQSDLAKASSYLERALTIQRAAHKPQHYALALNNLAIVELERADYQKADQLITQALDLHRRYLPDSYYLAEALDTAARIKRAEGQTEKAGHLYREAALLIARVAPHSPTAAEVEEGLSELLTDTHHLQEAKQHAEAALRLRELLTPHSDRSALVLGTLGRIARNQHSFVTGRNYYERALGLLDENALLSSKNSESQVRDQYADLYAAYIDFLVTEQGDTFHALEISERLRARKFLEMLQNAQVEVRADDPLLVSRRKGLLDALAALSSRHSRLIGDPNAKSELTETSLRIDSTLAALTHLDDDLAKVSPRTAEVTRPLMPKAQEIAGLLDDETVLLEFVLANPRSFVFVVSSGTISVYPLPARNRIHRVATELYNLWSDTPDDSPPQFGRKANADAASCSRQLAEMLLAPIGPVIESKHRLVIVADGVLNYVPFGALPGPKSSYLAAEHEIINVPSASVLSLIRHRPRIEGARKPALVFADPVFSNSDPRVKRVSTVTAGRSVLSNSSFRRLPYSRMESRYISAILPGTIEKLGFAASRREALSAEVAQYRVVHFATHGVLDNLNPGLSALVLSQCDENGKAQPGYLTLQDFYHLHLRADLVVLSACKTALGDDIQGEGIIGLTRGCMYSGAKQVISSLWEVNDAATAELMYGFYAGMQRGMPSQAALQFAQLQLAQKPGWEHPHFWAGFVVQGDWVRSH